MTPSWDNIKTALKQVNGGGMKQMNGDGKEVALGSKDNLADLTDNDEPNLSFYSSTVTSNTTSAMTPTTATEESCAKKPPRKRQRLTLVCDNCKKRKIRCDKQLPCSSCIRSNLHEACHYSNWSIGNKHSIELNHENSFDVEQAKVEIDYLKEKIKYLEDLKAKQNELSSFDNSSTSSRNSISSSHVSTAFPSVNDPPTVLPPINLKQEDTKHKMNYYDDLSCEFILDKITSSNSSPNSVVGVNPVANTSETINFYENYSTIHCTNPIRRVNYGPISWSSMMKRDDGLNMLWEYMITYKMGCLKESDIKKKKQDSNHDIDDEIEDRYNDLIKNWNKRSKENSDLMDMKHLKQKILNHLPPRRVTWCLISRFFMYVYPFAPFLDQQNFEDSMMKILGEKPSDDTPVDEKIKDLKINSKEEFAKLGLLFVIHRFSFLSMFTNNEQENMGLISSVFNKAGYPDIQCSKACVENFGYLIENPISVEVIELARYCLHLFPLNAAYSLPALQLMFYLRVYNRFAPEDGDGADGGDAQMSNAVIVQMAYHSGLNREPSKYSEDNHEDAKLNHIKRKTWHFIIFAELYHSYTFGNPSSLSSISYDTKIPFVNSINSSIPNVEVEEKVVSNLQTFLKFKEPIDKVLKQILNIDGKVKLIEVSENLSDLETLFFGHYLSIEHLLEKSNNQIQVEQVFDKTFADQNPQIGFELSQKIVTDDCMKIHDTKFYLSMSSFFVSIYFHLYLFYINKNHNLSFFYLKKSFIFLLEIVPFYSRIVESSDLVCDFILNPTLEMTIHKANQIVMSFIIKLGFVSYEMKKISQELKEAKNSNFYQYLNTVENFRNSLIKISNYSISQILKLSNRYYYAWRITKAHDLVLKTITSIQFYKDNYHHPKLNFLKKPKYSKNHLKELHSLVLDAIDRTINETNNRCSEVYVSNPEIDAKWMQSRGLTDDFESNKNLSVFNIFNDDL